MSWNGRLVSFIAVMTVLVLSLGSIGVVTSGHASEAWIAMATGSFAILMAMFLLFADPEDNFAQGPGLRLPVISLLTLLATTVWVVGQVGGRQAQDGATAGGGFGSWDIALVCFGLALAFLPLSINVARLAYYERNALIERHQRSQDPTLPAAIKDDGLEARQAVTATLVVGAIGGLAWQAGAAKAANTEMEWLLGPGFGLALFGFIILLFVIVIFAHRLADFAPVSAVAKAWIATAGRATWLARFYGIVDDFLVDIAANASGMAHRQIWRRYTLQTAQLVCLCVMGWYLPPPLGLIPLGIAFVLAFSVSRLWARVEEDRALAAMTGYNARAPYRIGFREDFRDETLLGFIFVFAVIPIAMMQAHESPYFKRDPIVELFTIVESTDKPDFLDWFAFFGVELAKAVLIVDWAEIYELSAKDVQIKYETSASRHAVFAARLVVDLVLIASLLQALGISGRNTQQKRLLATRQLVRLDEFVERIELQKSMIRSAAQRSGRPKHDLQGDEALAAFDLRAMQAEGVVDFRNYDPDRLREVRARATDVGTRSFIAAVLHQRNEPLSSAKEVAIEIAERGGTEHELIEAFEKAEKEHLFGVELMETDDVYRILSALRTTRGLKAFKQRAVGLMVRLGTPDEVIDRLSGLAAGLKADKFGYARDLYRQVISQLAPKAASASVVESVAEILDSETAANGGRVTHWTRVAIRALRQRLAEIEDRSTAPRSAP